MGQTVRGMSNAAPDSVVQASESSNERDQQSNSFEDSTSDVPKLETKEMRSNSKRPELKSTGYTDCVAENLKDMRTHSQENDHVNSAHSAHGHLNTPLTGKSSSLNIHDRSLYNCQNELLHVSAVQTISSMSFHSFALLPERWLIMTLFKYIVGRGIHTGISPKRPWGGYNPIRFRSTRSDPDTVSTRRIRSPKILPSRKFGHAGGNAAAKLGLPKEAIIRNSSSESLTPNKQLSDSSNIDSTKEMSYVNLPEINNLIAAMKSHKVSDNFSRETDKDTASYPSYNRSQHAAAPSPSFQSTSGEAHNVKLLSEMTSMDSEALDQNEGLLPTTAIPSSDLYLKTLARRISFTNADLQTNACRQPINQQAPQHHLPEPQKTCVQKHFSVEQGELAAAPTENPHQGMEEEEEVSWCQMKDKMDDGLLFHDISDPKCVQSRRRKILPLPRRYWKQKGINLSNQLPARMERNSSLSDLTTVESVFTQTAASTASSEHSNFSAKSNETSLRMNNHVVFDDENSLFYGSQVADSGDVSSDKCLNMVNRNKTNITRRRNPRRVEPQRNDQVDNKSISKAIFDFNMNAENDQWKWPGVVDDLPRPKISSEAAISQMGSVASNIPSLRSNIAGIQPKNISSMRKNKKGKLSYAKTEKVEKETPEGKSQPKNVVNTTDASTELGANDIVQGIDSDEWVCLFCQYEIFCSGLNMAKRKGGYYKRERQRQRRLNELGSKRIGVATSASTSAMKDAIG
ncbi:hypothetical protein DFQ28_011148 [Apophysomyces sp. BC1034]|nr:hypothetical protein DFQ29_009635 [Apophysomyces sp. BC1021]KAG0174402.1 hypothetical protein DFQ30_004475 [Apophysomyces sp. BC1015]KAG0184432.1 hypothetical protein DFQ28_011148 [Apophysomyces sp. BC1034]